MRLSPSLSHAHSSLLSQDIHGSPSNHPRRHGAGAVPSRRRGRGRGGHKEGWDYWRWLLERACALGLAGGDWERLLDQPPDRLHGIIRAADREFIHASLARLADVNAGLAGGSAYASRRSTLLSQLDALADD